MNSKLLRHFVPNLGTVLTVALLLFAYRAWAAPAAEPTPPPTPPLAVSTALTATAMLPAGATVGAVTPGVISYQGTLLNTTGQPLNGTLNMTFRLYAAPTGGTALWTEAHTGANAVPVSNGLFNVLLGSLTPISTSVWSNATLYLGVQVGSDAEMAPREAVGDVGSSQIARGLSGTSIEASGQLNISRDNMHAYGSDYTLGLSEDPLASGHWATIEFHNAYVNEGFIRLVGDNTNRKFVFGDNQGSGVGAQFTSALTWDDGGGGMAVGRANYGGHYSANAQPGDMVIRPSHGKRIILGKGDVSSNFPAALTVEASGLVVIPTLQHGSLIEANLQSDSERESQNISYFSQGDLLCWDIETERLAKCAEAATFLVQAVADANGKPVVLGAEPVKVLGPVAVGDLLVASEVPGYAMAWRSAAQPPAGAVIAQALAAFEGEQGLVKAMIRKF